MNESEVQIYLGILDKINFFHTQCTIDCDFIDLDRLCTCTDIFVVVELESNFVLFDSCIRSFFGLDMYKSNNLLRCFSLISWHGKSN